MIHDDSANLLAVPSTWPEHLSNKFAQVAFQFKPKKTFLVALLLLFISVFSLLRGYGGLFSLAQYTHDLFSVLDPAWRILNGQRPHIDFYSGIGPETYIQTALGLKISNGGAQGVVYGQIGFGLVAAFWTLMLASTRLRFSLACLASFCVFLWAIGPSNVGDSFKELTPGMIYNRSGYVLCFILLLEALNSPKPRPALELGGGFSTGAALAIALFTKSTCFIVGGFCLIALFSVRKQVLTRWVGIIVGFAVFCAAFMAYLRFDFSAVAHDQLLTAQGRYFNPAKVVESLLAIFSGESVALILLILVTAVLLRRQNERRAAFDLGLIGAVVLFSGTLLLFANKQERGLPLNAAVAILIAAKLLASLNRQPLHDRAIRLCLIVGAILFVVGEVSADLVAIPYAAFARSIHKVEPMKYPTLSAIGTRDTGYVEFIEDGLALADRHRKKSDTIISLDFSDFFSYALRSKPALGGTYCLHYNSTFNDKHHVAPERLIGNADIVMLPIEGSDPESIVAIGRIYGPYLANHFHLEAESELWKLYRRNST